MNIIAFLLGASLPLYLVRFQIGGIPTTLLEVLIWLCFLVVGFWVVRKRASVGGGISKYIWLAVLLFLLAGFVSVFVDPDKRAAAGLLKAFFIDGVLVFWVVLQLLKAKSRHLAYLTWGVLVSGIVVALDGYLRWIGGDLTPDGRLIGIYGFSPNYLSMYLSFVWLLALGEGIRTWLAHKKGLLAIYLALIGLFSVPLYLTGSRGGWLAILVGFLVLVQILIIKKSKVWRVLVGILAILILGSLFYLERPDVTDPGRKYSSANVRHEIWKTSFEMLKYEPLLGVGLSNYQNYFIELTKDRINYPVFVAPQALTAHNLYLHLWLTTGILGLLVFLYLSFKSIWEFIREVLKTGKLPPTLCWFLLLVGFLGYGLVDTPFYKNDLAVLLWMGWAVLLQIKK